MVFFFFFQAQVYFSAIWLLISFNVQFNYFVKRKEKSTIEQQKCKYHEKPDPLLVWKVEFNFQISHRNPSFLKLGLFDQNSSIHELL